MSIEQYKREPGALLSERIEVVDPGHEYRIQDLPSDTAAGWPLDETPSSQHIYFVKRFRGEGEELPVGMIRGVCGNHPGILIQDLLRVSIDRVAFLDDELSWDGNEQIIYHLRQALLLFEIRAITRKGEKGLLRPESVTTGRDGHWELTKREGGTV